MLNGISALMLLHRGYQIFIHHKIMSSEVSYLLEHELHEDRENWLPLLGFQCPAQCLMCSIVFTLAEQMDVTDSWRMCCLLHMLW